MLIAIHSKDLPSEVLPWVERTLSALKAEGFGLLTSERLSAWLERHGRGCCSDGVLRAGDDLSSVDMCVSLGGDGTLLDTLTYIGTAEIPILGVNFGRLGFLATTGREDFVERLVALAKGPIEVEKRTLVRFDSGTDVFGETSFGLNEFSVLKRDTSSMITVHAYLDGDYVNSYWGDGLIIATPTGSTGYSMSCGGPLLMPNSNSFVMTPVCPHHLTVRPMVVPDDAEIRLEVEGRAEHVLVALDSRSKSVKPTRDIRIRKEKFAARLVKSDKFTFFDTLRQKLHWGYDSRN
ncbi:NAD kinase [Fulvitalea axinellae]|uniref:NAD kinase n=1 Tax=Fulvitalea axinellae TaxID=1182444 RepID=A0AAU9CSX8_9BACT|nr:NAD kinase [Fulvitalea axinellae]